MTAEVDGRVATERSTLNAAIVHSSPGRVRFRVAPDDMPGEALDRVAGALAETHGVQEVKRSAVTNSVLLRFDPGTVGLPELLGAVREAGVDVNIEDGALLTASDASDATLGDTIGTFFTNADGRVRQALRGKADLRTLVPVGLGVLALRELLAGRLTAAPWYVLAWYAFDSFNKLRQNQQNADTPRA